MRASYDDEHDILYIDVAQGRRAHDTQPLNDDICL